MDEIEQAITKYFSQQWTTTSVQYPNMNINPKNLQEFVQLTIIPVDRYRLILGDPTQAARLNERGLVNINIFVKPNTGSGLAQGYATTIMGLFHYHNLTTESGYKLQFEVARVAQNGRNEGDWWMMTVICDYWIIN